MASVFDVAKYILEKHGSMSTWKLQKLVYYCQAWALVWDESPIFNEEIQAWANGPVCPQLYAIHRTMYDINVDALAFANSSTITEEQTETIDAVLDFYGNETGYYLRELTHLEDPWLIARGDTPDGSPSKAVITHESMRDYYGSL